MLHTVLLYDGKVDDTTNFSHKNTKMPIFYIFYPVYIAKHTPPVSDVHSRNWL